MSREGGTQAQCDENAPAVQCDQDDNVSNIERKIQGDQLLEGDQLQMSREGGTQVQCDQDAPGVQCDQVDNLSNIE